jgi:hypothetical protein
MDRAFIELLPWAANGTLSGAERKQVDEVLSRDPLAARELAWLESLQQRVQADAPDVSDEIGLERTLRRIHSEEAALARAAQVAASAKPAQPRNERRAPRAVALGARVREWFAGMALSPAFAMAALVIVAQAGVIYKLAGGDRDYEQIRSVPGAAGESGQLFRVGFKPEASETDMRMLLVTVQGNIESGPGQLGDYYVRVPADAALAAGAQLKASPIIESVLTVDAVPPRGH